MKRKYFGRVENDSGAGEAVDFETSNKNELKKYIRAHYGKGWKVSILAYEIDDDGQSGEPAVVEQFQLRK